MFALSGMGAAFVPELALDHKESESLAAAVAAVNSHYDTKVDPKIVAWIGLVACVGRIYGPRAIALKFRLAAKQKIVPKQPQQEQRVFPASQVAQMVSVPPIGSN